MFTMSAQNLDEIRVYDYLKIFKSKSGGCLMASQISLSKKYFKNPLFDKQGRFQNYTENFPW